MGGGGAGEIEAVSANSDTDTVYSGLGWYNGGNQLGVCEFTTLVDGRFCYREYSVGAGWHAGADALGEAS